MTFGEAVFLGYVIFATTAFTCGLAWMAITGFRCHLAEAKRGRERSEIPGVKI